jgi:hypothetical protein
LERLEARSRNEGACMSGSTLFGQTIQGICQADAPSATVGYVNAAKLKLFSTGRRLIEPPSPGLPEACRSDGAAARRPAPGNDDDIFSQAVHILSIATAAGLFLTASLR